MAKKHTNKQHNTQNEQDIIEQQAKMLAELRDTLTQTSQKRYTIPIEQTPTVARSLSIYFASKLDHAQLGQILSNEWSEFRWTARWPKLVGKVSNAPNSASIFWDQDSADIAKSDVVLVYAEAEDVLRGALVEAGMALALDKRVVVIGENASYSTWQHHRNVIKVADLTEARQILRTLAQ